MSHEIEVDEEAIFKVACEITSVEAREAYLDQVCPDDELKDRVRALLNADDEGAGFLEHPVVGPTLAAASQLEIPAKATETAIGPYKILQEIGEGGMGVVYMAEQTEPVKRRVALKIIKPGMDSGQVIARFEAERQALAMMDHPNIAKVLDAGTTGSSRPYFVMDLVKGVPITQFCDDHCLNARQRLELFTRVCRGVQHAHQKGIIHRDLKPSNVLVAEYDHQPVPKIIDFGVAKATNQELTEKTLFTQFGQIVGTLDYMSPEQAKFNQLDIDTRSDIYSLGVLLYELLTGGTPIEKDRMRSTGLEEILRVIREEEPPRPSTRVSSSDTLPAIAANRKTDPAKLAGQLREDLDWIVIKAMAKERSERYQTAEALADDIDRHLNDRPIEARRPSMAGRARRFIRRHKTVVAMSSLVAAAAAIAASLGAVAYLGSLAREKQKEKLVASQAEVDRTRSESQRVREAREVSMPEVQRLLDDRRPVEAFLLAREIRRELTGDPVFEALWEEMTVTVSFVINPEGTTVAYRDARNADGEWTVAGQAPLIDVAMPKGELRFRYSKEGYVTREFQRKFPNFIRDDGSAGSIRKDRGGDDGMVRVHRIRATSWNNLPTDLGAYLIDRYEVTNREFQEFIDAGGYLKPVFWTGLAFVRDGETLSWEQAMESFIDATGARGPADWRDGSFADGEEAHPVSGVSWFEAMAYANFRKKDLPTVHHWRWAAKTDQPGIMASLGNFSNRGTANRGTYVGIGRFDVYDLAGNVKEWCWNEDDHGRRCLLGGAWNEPKYRFQFNDYASPWDREPTYGFRCVRYLSDDAPEEFTLEPLETPARKLVGLERKPIDSLLAWYRYDRHLPLNAEQIQLDDESDPSTDFRHEVVRIDAAYNDERLDIHLFVPREKRRKYEAVVWVPGLGVWQSGGKFSAREGRDRRYVVDLVKSGRIVCQPIYKGTFDRWAGRTIQQQFEESPLKARDDFLAVSKDVSRAVDYLLTRQDVDPNRLVYFGLSMGAMRGPATLVADSRFNAGVFLSGGYHETLRELPEIHMFQFTPHVKVPVLMINGAGDTMLPYESSQLPFFEDLGSENKKHVVLPGDHNPPEKDVFREMDTWLKQVLKSGS